MYYGRREKYNIRKIRKTFINFILLLFVIFFLIYIFFNQGTKEKKDAIEIEKIKNIDNYLSQKDNDDNESTIYYISENGTSQNGTDINNPMNLETANLKTYKRNDKILFKCNDVFYGQINFQLEDEGQGMLYIGNYGKGELPIISGATVLNNENCWELEKEGVYKLDLSKKENFSGLGSIKDNLCNIGFIVDERNNIYGDRKQNM